MGLITISVAYHRKKLVTDLVNKYGNGILNSDESLSHSNSVLWIEFSNIIHTMNPNKSSGLDNIGPKLIKEVAEILINSLVHIFNLSLSTGVNPDK